MHKGEAYGIKLRKATLFKAIQRLKPPKVVYRIDKLVKPKGHTILRLSAYTCDLNAIVFEWSQVKHHIRSKNTV